MGALVASLAGGSLGTGLDPGRRVRHERLLGRHTGPLRAL